MRSLRATILNIGPRTSQASKEDCVVRVKQDLALWGLPTEFVSTVQFRVSNILHSELKAPTSLGSWITHLVPLTDMVLLSILKQALVVRDSIFAVDEAISRGNV